MIGDPETNPRMRFAVIGVDDEGETLVHDLADIRDGEETAAAVEWATALRARGRTWSELDVVRTVARLDEVAVNAAGVARAKDASARSAEAIRTAQRTRERTELQRLLALHPDMADRANWAASVAGPELRLHSVLCKCGACPASGAGAAAMQCARPACEFSTGHAAIDCPFAKREARSAGAGHG